MKQYEHRADCLDGSATDSMYFNYEPGKKWTCKKCLFSEEKQIECPFYESLNKM